MIAGSLMQVKVVQQLYVRHVGVGGSFSRWMVDIQLSFIVDDQKEMEHMTRVTC